MKVIDLTHTIKENMMVYPGTAQPSLRQGSTIEKDGFAETELNIWSHVGTHMDAPAHMIPGAPSLDELPADKFIGRAFVVECGCDGKPGARITRAQVSAALSAAGKLDFLLFHTGWDERNWGHGTEYPGGFPAFDEDAARLIASAGLKGIGIDAISIDPIDSVVMPVHHIILGAGLVVVENVKNLALIPQGAFTFAALPLKYRHADGAPVRAVAMVD